MFGGERIKFQPPDVWKISRNVNPDYDDIWIDWGRWQYISPYLWKNDRYCLHIYDYGSWKAKVVDEEYKTIADLGDFEGYRQALIDSIVYMKRNQKVIE